ncbi:trypsin-like serine peptidase [Massilia sp. TSP1-1-2]|uniref:trypsin-like serine peptidase n=1 Tax=Massilia sp. TSP1-1-2 TaxID=2804649 RepID=UPI003CF5C8FE
MNESGYTYQADDASSNSSILNGDGRLHAAQNAPQLNQQGDELDAAGAGAGFHMPAQGRVPAKRDEGGPYVAEEVSGEALVEITGVESSAESIELNTEVANPGADGESAGGYFEATPEQIEAAGTEESGEAGLEEGLFDVIGTSAPTSFETGDVHEAGFLLHGQQAGSQQEFFGIFSALIPTFVTNIGPAVAKRIIQALTPRALAVVKSAAATVLTKPGGMKMPGKNLFPLLAKGLQAAAARELMEGVEAGVELNEATEALALEAAYSIESIIQKDQRKQIKNPASDPWRRICLLRITYPNGETARGTGFFIGNRTLMTAGHCVYMRDQGGWARKIEVVPGADGNTCPYGVVVSSSFRSVKGWVNGQKPECDYACVVLPTGSFNGHDLGKFGFGVFDGQQLLANFAVLAGYPEDKPLEMWGMKRRVKSVTPKTLIYDIDTYGGQSGAPVYIKRNGKRYVVGIHNYGSLAGNSATRVTAAVFDRMKNWSAL